MFRRQYIFAETICICFAARFLARERVRKESEKL